MTAAALISRVVTDVGWSPGAEPPNLYSYGDVVLVRATVANIMTSEGIVGSMFSRVVWSDGAEQDVGYLPAAGVEEMSVSVSSSGVSTTAPSGNQNFWQIGVAVGAVFLL